MKLKLSKKNKWDRSNRFSAVNKMLRLDSALFIRALAILIPAAFFSLLIKQVYSVYPAISFIFTLFVLAFGLNLVSFFIKRKLSVLFFLLFSGLLTWNISELGVYGWAKIVVFLIAGIIFELCSLILKDRTLMNWLPLANLIGTILALVSIPMIVSLYLSTKITLSFPSELINIYLISVAVSFFGSFLSFLLWDYLHDKKLLIKLQSWLGTL